MPGYARGCKDTLQEVAISLHHTSSRNHTQAIMVGSKHLHLLIHHPSPSQLSNFFFNFSESK